MPFSSALRMAAWFASVVAPFALMADLLTLRRVADTRVAEHLLDSYFGNTTDVWSTASAAIVINELGSYTFDSTTNLIADVQSWVDNSSANFGWIVLSQLEDVGKTARHFASREGGASAPTLAVQFVPPPVIA